MPNDAKIELQGLLNQQGSNPMQHTKDEPEHYKQIQTEAELTFVNKCCKSKYTEACLELMKEGKVPFRLVNAILNDDFSLWNQCLSFFKSDISLESLIGKYNIAILKQGDKCIALDPTDRNNDDKIKDFFNNAKDKGRLIICSHGSGAYHDRTNTMQRNDKDTTLYLSNIPSGLIATNSGIQERHNKYKNIIQSSAKYFNEKNKDNQKNIIIETLSYSNLLGAMIAKTSAEAGCEISELNLMNVANGYCCFQSADNIANTILSIKPDAIGNIKEINTASDGSISHPVENGKYLSTLLTKELSEKSLNTQVNNAYVYSTRNGKRERYTGEFNNDKFNGKGKLIGYNKDGKLEYSYEGGFNDGKFNGKGKLMGYNEDGKLYLYYEGEFNDDKFNGKGTLMGYNEDGKLDHSYEGGFNDGKINGKGKLIFYKKDGKLDHSYEGEFNDGKLNGKGKQIGYNKDGKLKYSYEGEFNDGKFNGKGKLIFYKKDGKLVHSYEGEFLNDKKHGKFKISYYDEYGNPIAHYNQSFENDVLTASSKKIIEQHEVSNNDISQHSQNNDINNSKVEKYNLQGIGQNKSLTNDGQ